VNGKSGVGRVADTDCLLTCSRPRGLSGHAGSSEVGQHGVIGVRGAVDRNAVVRGEGGKWSKGGAQTRPNVIAAQVANFMAFFLEMLVIEPPPDDQAPAIARRCASASPMTTPCACRAATTNGRERDAMPNGIYTPGNHPRGSGLLHDGDPTRPDIQ